MYAIRLGLILVITLESGWSRFGCSFTRHVLPRHVGDTNFITTIGETRVIPDLLERQYDQLFPYMQD